METERSPSIMIAAINLGRAADLVLAAERSCELEPDRLDALDCAARAGAELAGAQTELVRLARERHYTWQSIADVLGVSKQAAQHRYRPLL